VTGNAVDPETTIERAFEFVCDVLDDPAVLDDLPEQATLTITPIERRDPAVRYTAATRRFAILAVARAADYSVQSTTSGGSTCLDQRLDTAANLLPGCRVVPSVKWPTGADLDHEAHAEPFGEFLERADPWLVLAELQPADDGLGDPSRLASAVCDRPCSVR
jgi:hypothetical protein